jgi:STE24 endopeptidase
VISSRRSSKAKTYNRIKLTTGVSSSVFVFSWLLTLVLSGWSREIDRFAHGIATDSYGALFIFVVSIGVLQGCVTLPLACVSGYWLEHRYGLSNQTIGGWLLERIKGYAVGLPLAVIVLAVLYFSLKTFGIWWWLPVASLLTILSVVLARLAPVLIFPLFYRFTPLVEGDLRDRIHDMCTRAGIRVEGIYSFDMSKNTKKANAGFAGVGKSRRIILADTLLQEFTNDEIETVFAHEMGHYVRRHIVIGILIGTVSTFANLFLAAQLYQWSMTSLGYSSLTELAALPLLAIWLLSLGLLFSPIGNSVSRHHERQADTYAVRRSEKKDAFIGALRKLGAMNLSDPDPHPLIVFFFYSHPPIAKRISFIESL